MSKLTISYLFFAISFTFSQTEVSQLIKAARDFADKKDYKSAIINWESAFQKMIMANLKVNL